MKILSLDFETYYDDVYSLRKMPVPVYVLDDRFECQMCAVQEDTGQPYVVDGPDFGKFIGGFKPEQTITLAFNALFDNSILAWRYGFIPHLMLDAMGMARALLGHRLKSASLNAVAEALGLGTKTDVLAQVKGMRRAEIVKLPELWKAFQEYALQDLALLVGITDRLLPVFPSSERKVMDLVLRCAVEPRFQADTRLLVSHIEGLQKEKANMRAEAGVGIDELMSTAKFVERLQAIGVKIETKINAKGNEIPALAKTDKFMTDLLEHEDPRVQALAAARLGHKSTIEETRAAKLLYVSCQKWPAWVKGNLPVALAYGKAHTQRLAGDWGMNMQNLPTARGSKGKSKLRNALIAPEG